MNSIKKEFVLSLPKGQIVVAVQSDGFRKAFFTQGLGYEGDTKRKHQIEGLGEVIEFLFPTEKEIIDILNNDLNV